MALPSLNKTWQITPNVEVGSTVSRAEAVRDFFYNLKQALVGFPLNPWLVVSSCGKVGGSTWTAGPSDYWDVPAAVVGSIGSSVPDGVVLRAWIVLRQSGMTGGNFQVLIDMLCSSVEGTYYNLHVSPSAGFTGGDTTHRPTATDGIYYGQFPTGFNSGYKGRMHAWQTTDGSCTRLTMYRSYGQYFWLAFETPKNPYAGWTNPFMACCQSEQATAGQTYYGDQNTNALYRGEYGYAYLTAEGWGTNPSGLNYSGPDEILPGPTRAFFPMGMASHSAGWRGARKGQLYDLWWFNGSSDRSLIPDDASRQFVVIGDMALPWDGSTTPLWSA